MQAKNTFVILGQFFYYIALLTLVIVAVSAAFGIYSVGFVTVIGAASLAVGFDLQDSLADFSVGAVLLILKPSKVALNIASYLNCFL
jgi:small-conductance mechanosensitive channel